MMAIRYIDRHGKIVGPQSDPKVKRGEKPSRDDLKKAVTAGPSKKVKRGKRSSTGRAGRS